jgi:hypothetical protein
VAPRGYDVVFRECGALTFEGAGGALVLRDFPVRGAAFAVMVAGFRGSFSSFYAFTKTTGRVVVESTDAARGDARFSLTTSPRR